MSSLPDLRKRIEALLFVAGEPLSERTLCAIANAPAAEVRVALAEITADSQGRGFVLKEAGGGWRFYSSPACRDIVERLLRPPKTTLSAPSMETLAVIAYLQPVTKAEIEAIRGVNCDAVLATLGERGFVQEVGRKEVVGRPLLFGTTDFFLESFALRSLDDLPPLPQGGPQRRDGRIIALPLLESA